MPNGLPNQVPNPSNTRAGAHQEAKILPSRATDAQPRAFGHVCCCRPDGSLILITVILDRHHSRLTSLSSRRRELGWWDTETITVAEEQHLRILAPGTSIRLNPLAPSRTLEQGLDEADRAALSIGPVVLAHDWLDGVRCLVGVIEWDRGDVVVQDMGFYDAVEDVATDKAELTIDRSSSTTSEVPGFTGVVGKGGIGVLEVGDGD